MLEKSSTLLTCSAWLHRNVPNVTAGIDFALTLVSIMVNRQTAEAIQLGLEYNPAPPFNAGSPDTAPPEILALMKEKIAPAQARRSEAIHRAAARLTSPHQSMNADRLTGPGGQTV